MSRGGILFVLSFITPVVVFAQLGKAFTVENNTNFDKVKFSLITTNGQCSIGPSLENHLMNIYSNSEEETPQFVEEIIGRTKQIDVRLEDKEAGFSSTISKQLFSKQKVNDFAWKVYLSKIKPFDLNLIYAVGDAYIDLSGLPIEKLKMNTGSANVNIDYKNGIGNRLEMDTFMVKVDMGTLHARNLYLSNARNIIADVGFGKMEMDFANAKKYQTHVKATVGAGKLEVIIPDENVSVKINVNDSPLCRIKVPDDFKKIGKSEFVSKNYNSSSSNIINFDVDVAVGNIVFRPAHN